MASKKMEFHIEALDHFVTKEDCPHGRCSSDPCKCLRCHSFGGEFIVEDKTKITFYCSGVAWTGRKGS